MLLRGWDRRTTVLLTFALLFVISTNLAHAQVFDLERDRVQMTELHGLWRFHTGDDLRWADPAFDDSSWSLLPSDRNWSDQPNRGYGGLAWYRFKVALAPKHDALALYIPEIWTSYQIFVNGNLIGQVGGMPPHPKVTYAFRQLFSIPQSSLGHEHTLSIAIRLWCWPRWAGVTAGAGGVYGAVRIGDARVLEEWRSLQSRQQFWSISTTHFALLLDMLISLASLLLFALRPSETEYFWFGFAELSSLAADLIIEFTSFHQHSFELKVLLQNSADLAFWLLFLLFIKALLKDRMSYIYGLAIG
jgi:phosphoserine phosphatase RsbU/P